MAGIFLEEMNPSFNTKGDAMKPGYFWGHRTKYIHSVGATGKVRFVPNVSHANQFTGVLKGADYGLIRLSSATQPSSSSPLGPGMGLKFLRDGVDSANLVSMFSVDGQPGDWDFFSHDFTTTIAHTEDVKLRLLSKKFSTATDHIQTVGLSDFGGVDQSGQREGQNKFPFRLRFEPTSEVKGRFSKTLAGNDHMVYVDQLKSLPANTSLYNVYAYDGPPQTTGKESLIGKLQLDGKLISSKWGDENLFFRHQKLADDL